MLPKKLLIVFALIIIISLSVFAEDVKVLMNNGKTYEGELLGLTATTVFLKDSSGKVSELSVTDVKAIFNSKTHQSIPLPKTSVPGPTPTSTPDIQSSLKLEKNRFAPGEEIRLTFVASADCKSNAWIGIIPSKIVHGSESENDKHDIKYQYLNGKKSGVLTFKAPTKPGNYDFRLNSTDNNGIELTYVSFVVGSKTTVPTRELPPKIKPQPRQAITGKPDYGVRFSLSLGLLPWYFGNKDMIDSWKANVPSSEYDGLEFLAITFDVELVFKIYERFSMGVFYGMFGPEISKSLTYTTSGYWYYYYGVWYYQPAGSYTETWRLAFSNSTHTGVIFRYYLSPYDKQNNSTFSGGVEGYVELCVGTTNLEGAFFKNSTERLVYFTGTGPYYHIGAGINFKLKPKQPFFASLKFRIPLGKVTSIENENGDIVYNADGSKFTVEYSSIQLFNVGIGLAF